MPLCRVVCHYAGWFAKKALKAKVKSGERIVKWKSSLNIIYSISELHAARGLIHVGNMVWVYVAINMVKFGQYGLVWPSPSRFGTGLLQKWMAKENPGGCRPMQLGLVNQPCIG
jgi:hypothetical protein